jgi:hypothetical protein
MLTCLPAARAFRCRVTARTFGVVHVLVAGKPSEDRLAQKADQQVPAVLAGARIGEGIGTCIGEAQRVIQFPVGEQPGIRGDRRTAKLQHQAPVEIEPQRTPIRLIRRISQRRPTWSPQGTKF